MKEYIKIYVEDDEIKVKGTINLGYSEVLKINKMDAEKVISDAEITLKHNKEQIKEQAVEITQNLSRNMNGPTL